MSNKQNMIKNFNKLAGISFILFPIMLLLGFVMHPDLFKMEMTLTSKQLVEHFYQSWMYHVGHLIVALAIPFIICAVIYMVIASKDKGARIAFIGGVIAIIGAVILALDKGSLCLVLSGFNTLSEVDIMSLEPHLQVLVDKKGLLAINWLIFLLPIGTIIQAIGMIKDLIFTKAQGMIIISGLLLLNNPDIELISTVGSTLMCIGYIPFGVKVISENV